ncbi:hypothetical protein PR048_026819 [Dryococelus australis]|uniref:Uncharacterized protein n=1 Tax=Dryococelus australis TaxID=614101 RepID=A0ABQ9GMD1_9NEOP|nr:hypothetical protein PR048_026819 [Dryococelus australis]
MKYAYQKITQSKKKTHCGKRRRASAKQHGPRHFFENQKHAKVEKSVFVEDTVRIKHTIRKIYHRAARKYLEKFLSGSDHLPDETLDSRGRCVFAVLFRTKNSAVDQQTYLVMCYFLDSANGTTCSQAILESLNQYGVAFQNVLDIASYSARYTNTCLATLQIVLGDHTIQVKCWAQSEPGGSILRHFLSFFSQWDPKTANVKSVCQKLSGGQFSVGLIKIKVQICNELKRYADGVWPSQTQQMSQEIKSEAVKASIKSAISSCCVKSYHT